MNATELIQAAQLALNQSRWAQAKAGFIGALQALDAQGAGLSSAAPNALRAHVQHNLALAHLGLGEYKEAVSEARQAQQRHPPLWQSALVMGKAFKGLGQPDLAWRCFDAILKQRPQEPQARLALADLCMNQFGQPLMAQDLVAPLLGHAEYGAEAWLTRILASLYDRDTSAQALALEVRAFAQAHLQLEPQPWPSRPPRAGVHEGRVRPRVGLISPLFCASPVYFLTIHGFRHVAKGSDLVIFHRGHQRDWATEAFRSLACEWHEVQDLPAMTLAQTLQEADLDVLYDLGGWMDAVALMALSVKPARAMYKWVGGQSITTGLQVFDGWIGDPWQSPLEFQALYTEPLINVSEGYATYTPPDYLPKGLRTPSKRRREPVVFANPAKLSRRFLSDLRSAGQAVVFIHHQFRLPGVKERISRELRDLPHEFLMPTSHPEALSLLAEFRTLLDTYPYSGGLTVREARALGLSIQGRVGELFCERHAAQWLKPVKS